MCRNLRQETYNTVKCENGRTCQGLDVTVTGAVAVFALSLSRLGLLIMMCSDIMCNDTVLSFSFGVLIQGL